MNINEKIYKEKQEWLEKVMASSLTPAQKVFAFGIFTHMYGTKITSYPDTERLIEATGLARSKYSEYRTALFDAGAMTGTKDRKARGRQENYTYTLNLAWAGQVPSGNVKSPVGTSPVLQVPSGDSQVPSGGSNTTRNTTTLNTTSKTTTTGPVVASAPTDAGMSLSDWDCVSQTHSLKNTLLTGSKDVGLPFEVQKVRDFEYIVSGLTSRDTVSTQVPTRDLKVQDDFWSEEAVEARLAELGMGRQSVATEVGTDNEW